MSGSVENLQEGAAASVIGLTTDDRVELACMSFDNTPERLATNGAVDRGATMVHESVHQRYGDHFLGSGGMPHSAAGDDWYTHGVFYGQLGVGIHSAVQLQVEYLCDIAEFPAGWVPFSVYTTAAADANTLIEESISSSQDPGWRCGDLKPFP